MGLFKKSDYRKPMNDSEDNIKDENPEVVEDETESSGQFQPLPQLKDDAEDVKKVLEKTESPITTLDIHEKRISDLEKYYNALHNWCIQFHKVYKRNLKEN